MNKVVKALYGYQNIDGLIPGVKGQRAFPSGEFKASDPFLMLDHIGPERVGADFFLDGKGHDHPHRGFETITFMFEGKMHHRDSMGNKELLESGSVQRMNAGSGIIHGGDMASDPQTQRFHELQLWVNNPIQEKMSIPEIQNIDGKSMPVLRTANMELRIISGILNGIKGKIKTKAATQIAHLLADGEGSISIGSFPKGNTFMIYVLEGNVLIDEKVIREFQLAVCDSENTELKIDTEQKAQLLILSGKPLNEPIAFGGPFVMNTQEEINQAYSDYEQGKFGSI